MPTVHPHSSPARPPAPPQPGRPSVDAALALPWYAILAGNTTSPIGLDPDVLDRCYADLLGAYRDGDRAFALACWALSVGRLLESNGERILVHMTGTFIARAGCAIPAAYRARHRLVAALGAVLVPGEPGANGHIPLHVRLLREGRVAAGQIAMHLWRGGRLPEPRERPAANPIGGPVWLPLDLVRRPVAGHAAAHCPGHDDRSPSLSVLLHPDGTGAARCHAAGCRRRWAVRTIDGLLLARESTRNTPQTTTEKPASDATITIHGPPLCPTASEPMDPGPLLGFPTRPPCRVAMSLVPTQVNGRVVALPRFSARGPPTLDVELGTRWMSAGARAFAEATKRQRYESIGRKAPGDDPGDWRRSERTGAWWPAKYGIACGVDRVVVDVDALRVCETRDGSDPGLLDVLRDARERAVEDPILRHLDLVETGPDGVQARLWLHDPWDAAEEAAYYAQPAVRDWLEGWGAWFLTRLDRGGHLDDSTWKPGAYCRRPGWRWSKRVGVMFRARLVDEGDLMCCEANERLAAARAKLAAGDAIRAAEARRTWTPVKRRGTPRSRDLTGRCGHVVVVDMHRNETIVEWSRAGRGGDRLVEGRCVECSLPHFAVARAVAKLPKAKPAKPAPAKASKVPKRGTPIPVVVSTATGPDPHPASVVEAIAAEVGGNIWIGRDQRVFRVYFGEEWCQAEWPRADGTGTQPRGVLTLSSEFSKRRAARIARVTAGAGSRRLVDSAEALALTQRLAGALGGKSWSRGEHCRVYWGVGEEGRWIEVRAPYAVPICGIGVEPFVRRRAAALLREWRRESSTIPNTGAS